MGPPRVRRLAEAARAAGYRAISLINLINAPAENKSRSHVGVHLFNFFAPFVLPRARARVPADINHAGRRVVSPHRVISVQKLICAATRSDSFLKNANSNRRGIRARAALVDIGENTDEATAARDLAYIRT